MYLFIMGIKLTSVSKSGPLWKKMFILGMTIYILYFPVCWMLVMSGSRFKKASPMVMANATSLSCANISCRSRTEAASQCTIGGHICRAIWFKQDGGQTCGMCFCAVDPDNSNDMKGIVPYLHVKTSGNFSLGTEFSRSKAFIISWFNSYT